MKITEKLYRGFKFKRYSYGATFKDYDFKKLNLEISDKLRHIIYYKDLFFGETDFDKLIELTKDMSRKEQELIFTTNFVNEVFFKEDFEILIEMFEIKRKIKELRVHLTIWEDSSGEEKYWEMKYILQNESKRKVLEKKYEELNKKYVKLNKEGE